MTQPPWHNLPVKEILSILKVDREKGLSEKEAAKRLGKFGPNKLPEKKPLSWAAIMISQFKSPLIYILCLAAAVCFFLREFIDMGVILAAIVVNTLIGFFQEYKADRTLWQLKKLIYSRALVWRDGAEHMVGAESLVPGDIVLLGEGDKVPADGRLIKAKDLVVMEAALTGESMPSYKKADMSERGAPLADRENMVFMGTQIEKGKGTAVITSTGSKTELGKIALLVRDIPREKTPLQKQFGRLSRGLSIILLGLCLLIFVLGLLRHHSFIEMLLISIALAVAAIPEGLPAAITICLAIGMQRMLGRKGLVRKMVAAETLGSTGVICTDKTGTLTEGRMAVAEIVVESGEGFHSHGRKEKALSENGSHDIVLALKIGLLCNNAAIENPDEELEKWIIFGDSTEKALLLAATQAGLDKAKLEKEMPRLDEIPFDSEKKYMATLHKKPGAREIIYMKGAPEKVLAASSFVNVRGKEIGLDKDKAREITKRCDELTGKGLRVLAVAYKELRIGAAASGISRGTGDKDKPKDIQNLYQFADNSEIIRDFVFVGLIGLKDPLRPEAKETVRLCQRAGIRLVIITGDHRLTARAIAAELGMKAEEDNILEGKDIDALSDEELKKIVRRIDVYARVEPKHKLRIIGAWQAVGEAVAMTGDGVNDAPALKAADVGVALGSGTDVAKEVSDIVLLDDNFKTIVKAVEQGRVIFENIKKITLYLLADSFSEILLIGGSLLLGLPLPILPAQILWVNLVEDGLPNAALAFEPGEKEVMDDPPRKKKAPILDLEMKILIFIIGLINNFVLLVLFWWLYKAGTYDLAHIRTIIFVVLGLNSLFYVFSCRSLRSTFFHKNPFSNKYLVAAVLVGLAFMVSGVYFPPFQGILRTVSLSPGDWIMPVALSILEVITIEITKWFFIVKKKHESRKA